MLFSHRDLADFINTQFEPIWETVRPAPLVTLDFGNGHIVRRTLQGNIATYICTTEGIVHDVLPGMYHREGYQSALEKCLTTIQRGTGPEYHRKQAEQLALQPTTARMLTSATQGGGGFKGGIIPGTFTGNGLSGGVVSGGFSGSPQQHSNFGGNPFVGPKLGGIEGPTETVIMHGTLAAHPELVFDTQVNETIRRKQIHEYLAGREAVRPGDMKKWLFKEVLRADLDDPLLGLGGILNVNYPFNDEDRRAQHE